MNNKLFKILLSTALIGFCFNNLLAQRGDDLSVMEYGKKVVKDLCAPDMNGRGYVGNGDEKAAKYIRKQFKEMRLEKLKYRNKSQFFQPFYFKVNTFPGAMTLNVNGRPLEPGTDFLVKPNSGGTDTRRYLSPVILKKAHVNSEEAYDKLDDKDLDNKALIIDKDSFADFKNNERYQDIKENDLGASALIYLHSDDLVWGTSTEALKYPVMEAKRSAFPDSPQMVTINVKQNFKTSEKTQNVVSYIEGRENPDSFIVFTAHYDHLGRMGSETYFPGANDNASGVSMMLNLARYFTSSRKTPDYSVVFIAFTGEEAGLLGSHQFVDNPMLGLEKIEFLINLDMMGTGKDGMMTVNGKVFDDAFDKLVKLNEKGNYFDTLDKRGEAANSDHHFFYKNEVPCFFCYLQEDYPHYHDVNDKPENLSYAGYEPAFNLFVDFVESYNKKRRGRR